MTCRFCGDEIASDDLLHVLVCDGRQGAIEAKELPDGLTTPVRFNGAAYEPRFDDTRLTGQLARIWAVMADGAWRTLDEIARLTNDPPASISAQLRHLRKPRFGAHTVARQIRGERSSGLYEYRVIRNNAPRRDHETDH